MLELLPIRELCWQHSRYRHRAIGVRSCGTLLQPWEIPHMRFASCFKHSNYRKSHNISLGVEPTAGGASGYVHTVRVVDQRSTGPAAPSLRVLNIPCFALFYTRCIRYSIDSSAACLGGVRADRPPRRFSHDAETYSFSACAVGARAN